MTVSCSSLEQEVIQTHHASAKVHIAHLLKRSLPRWDLKKEEEEEEEEAEEKEEEEKEEEESMGSRGYTI